MYIYTHNCQSMLLYEQDSKLVGKKLYFYRGVPLM